MSTLDSWEGPLTWAQYQAIKAEAAARGEDVLIDTVITDLPTGLRGILWDLTGIGGPPDAPQAHAQAEPEI